MRPFVFKLATLFKPATATKEEAVAQLSRLLPRLKVRLKAVGKDGAEMSAQLFKALTNEYGQERAAAILARLGLADAHPLDWPQVLRRELRSREGGVAGFWNRLGGQLPVQKKDEPLPHWHLDLCNACTVPVPLPDDWLDIKVGQIDTGYTEHRALGLPGKTWVDTRAARSFDGLAGEPGRDRMRGVYAGHGTSSASLCTGFDPEDEFYGVAPCVPFVPVRVGQGILLDQRAYEFEAAVRYLVDEAGVQVINVSMGTFLAPSAPEPIWRAVNHCYEQGVLLIAAAGNVPLRGWPAYPGALPRTIAVAGVERSGKPWLISSCGEWVDVSAPATGLRRAFATKFSTSTYTSAFGGTTCAAAMVSGAAARWLRQHHDELQAYDAGWQRVEAFRQAVRKTATRPGHWNSDAGYGAGILNIDGLLTTLLPAAATLTPR